MRHRRSHSHHSSQPHPGRCYCRAIRRQFAIATGHRHENIIPSDLLQASREAWGLALSRLQAEAIGALRLIQLVGPEIEKLVADYAELLSKIRLRSHLGR